jgi:hypothetical protein
MSIDLCNKFELTKGLGESLSWENSSHKASVGPAQREALQIAHRTLRNSADPRTAAGDPAAWTSEFAYALDRAAVRLDRSEGVIDSHIGFMRQGCWFLEPRFTIRGEAPAIRYVRGRFQGWGFTNLAHVAGKPLEDILLPGNAILSTLHNPVAGPMTNVFISGTFKGKLNDWDGDGIADRPGVQLVASGQ